MRLQPFGRSTHPSPRSVSPPPPDTRGASCPAESPSHWRLPSLPPGRRRRSRPATPSRPAATPRRPRSGPPGSRAPSPWMAASMRARRAGAQPASEFTQTDPAEGQPATERTEVRVLIGDDALYVGARLYDREPSRIKAALARRDDEVEADEFDVYLDTFHDHLSGVRFRVTPGGATLDGILGSSAQGSDEDHSWDPVWESATQLDSLGWTAEIRIPLSQLRYNSTRGRHLGYPALPQDPAEGRGGLVRVRAQERGERGEPLWPPRRAGPAPGPAPAGAAALRAGRGPYAPDRQPATRSGAAHDYHGSAGLDLKYGLTSDLTLNATVNPGLRPGRGGPCRGQPQRVRDLLSREAPLLRRGRRRLPLRRHPGLQQLWLSAVLLQPPHRPSSRSATWAATASTSWTCRPRPPSAPQPS